MAYLLSAQRQVFRGAGFATCRVADFPSAGRAFGASLLAWKAATRRMGNERKKGVLEKRTQIEFLQKSLEVAPAQSFTHRNGGGQKTTVGKTNPNLGPSRRTQTDVRNDDKAGEMGTSPCWLPGKRAKVDLRPRRLPLPQNG